MEISAYQPANLAACLALFDSNLGKYFDITERDGFVHFLEKKPIYFVGRVDGKIVACGGYFFEKDVAGLSWGMVHREFHGRGFGDEFSRFRLQQIVEKAKTKVVRVETSQYTEGFYARFGFEVVERKADGFAQGIDLVEMRTSLNALKDKLDNG